MSPPRGRIVVGLHPVRELLRAGRAVRRIRLAASRTESPVVADIRRLAASAGVPCDSVERDELDRLATGLVHQGVVADAPPFTTRALGEVVAAADGPLLLVAVDGVTDPHNLGSIARTAEAVGAHGLVLPARRNAPVTPTVEKAAAGALAHLPVTVVTNLAQALRSLRGDGVWSIGLDAGGDVELADSPLLAEPCVLVVGAEGTGLARLTREVCDVVARLPMVGHVGSLNASVAAGVALYTILGARRP